MVQSFNINGKQPTLPNMSFFTKSHKSLAELEKSTMKTLSAATGYKCSGKEIFGNVNFVMTL